MQNPSRLGPLEVDRISLRGAPDANPVNGSLPLVGALVLYLDFINMFLFLLRFLGDRRRRRMT